MTTLASLSHLGLSECLQSGGEVQRREIAAIFKHMPLAIRVFKFAGNNLRVRDDTAHLCRQFEKLASKGGGGIFGAGFNPMTYLDLSGSLCANHVDEHVDLLRCIGRMKSLEPLLLADCNLDHVFCELMRQHLVGASSHLFKMSPAPQSAVPFLHTLDLSCNLLHWRRHRLSRTSISPFMNLRHGLASLPSLTHLSLSGNEMSIEGARDLFARLPVVNFSQKPKEDFMSAASEGKAWKSNDWVRFYLYVSKIPDIRVCASCFACLFSVLCLQDKESILRCAYIHTHREGSF